MEDLPLPHMSQKYVIMSHRPAAVKLRAEHTAWIRTPQVVIASYMAALEATEPAYATTPYIYVQEGAEVVMLRSEVVVDKGKGIVGIGDADTSDRSQMVAALHAVLLLIGEDLIDAEAMPKRGSQATPIETSSAPAVLSASAVAPLPELQPAVAVPQPEQAEIPEVVDPRPLVPEAQPGASQVSAVSPSRPPVQPQPMPELAAAATPTSHGFAQGTDLQISLETAREFMDWYCKKFKLSRPDLNFQGKPQGGKTAWTAILSVSGKSIGGGKGASKRDATSQAYIDACSWLSQADPPLWTAYRQAEAQRKAAENKTALLIKHFPRTDVTPAINFKFSERMDERLRDVIWAARDSKLYKQAMVLKARQEALIKLVKEASSIAKLANGSGEDGIPSTNGNNIDYDRQFRLENLQGKSSELRQRFDDYQDNPKHAKMRKDRAALPVYAHASELLQRLEENQVVVVMAQTGSGKTTQIPQIILDDWIKRGKGGECNIVCTQPRRLAAISVAQRIANERGERLEDSVGYQVRFEYKPPKPNGSILFCTTGIFLKKLQRSLDQTKSSKGAGSFLDDATHIIVDESHERDIDVDLLLFVLRRHLEERRKAGKHGFKVILMSATIDPALFCTYFKNPETQRPCPTLDIPGRTFPVQKFYLNDIIQSLSGRDGHFGRAGWVLEDKDVKAYLDRELQNPLPEIVAARTDDMLKLPSALIALTVAYVAQKTRNTRDGHILVFLPGLEEIKAVQRILLDNRQSLLDIDFGQYELHVLHSAVPVAEQQAVFAAAPPGLQRIILATNIAETSVTIPDVVYVVDAGKCKEKRFDPERHLSSLVSAFTGLGNMKQRAGRAGRHREGEYYSMVSQQRLAVLPQNQTVEMKRLDLSNVVMHVKGLDLPMEVEEVLDAVIEPPEHQRVVAAIRSLEMVGALDSNKNLTSLGRVLLQLPVEAAIGKLCLLGCFFRCLDQALTIAAILTNREPFVAPLERRKEANAAKARFAPPGFSSDILAVLAAFNQWSSLPEGYERRAFADDNFLSGSTLNIMQQVKDHILQALERSGALRISAGGRDVEMQRSRLGKTLVPEVLNKNGECLPLLAALICAAVAPNFAIRKTAVLLRTAQDPAALIHPSSLLCHRKTQENVDGNAVVKKQVYAYAEATRNVSQGVPKKAGKQDSQLRGVTLLDPLGLLLFGVHKLNIVRNGFMCDGWLPVTGNVGLLDDLERFKDALQLSLLRVFEGLGVAMSQRERGTSFQQSHSYGSGNGDLNDAEEDELANDAVDCGNPALSGEEVNDLDLLTKRVVEVLSMHAQDNGLPIFAKIARQPSARDLPAFDTPDRYEYGNDIPAGSRPVGWGRAGGTLGNGNSSQPQATREGEQTNGWGSWGSTQHTPQKSGTNAVDVFAASSQDIPAAGFAQTNGNGWSAHATSTSANGWSSSNKQETRDSPARQSPITIAAAPAQQADDGWGSYQPAAQTNDAFERRAAPSRGESLSMPVPSVFPPSQDGTASASGSDSMTGFVQSQPVTLTAASTDNSHHSQPAEDDGWGSYQPKSVQNDAFERRAALSRGEALQAPAVPVSQYAAPTSMTPQETSMAVSQPNSTPAASAGDTLSSIPVQDDGWGRYQPASSNNDAFERRKALSMRSPVAPSILPAVNALRSVAQLPAVSTADAASGWTSNGRSSQECASQSAPRASEGQQSQSVATPSNGWSNGWNSSTPAPVSQVPTATHSRPQVSSAVANDLLSRLNGSAAVNGPELQPASVPAPLSEVPVSTVDYGWGSWSSPVKAEGGEEAYRRRQNMSQGNTSWSSPAPSSYHQQPSQPSPSRTLPEDPAFRSSTPAPQQSHAGAEQSFRNTETTDGWMNYNPSPAADRDGEIAYQRRAAQSRSTSVSVSVSSQYQSYRSATPSPASNLPPPIIRPKGGISIKGRHTRLVSETQAREAAGDRSPELQKKKEALEAIQTALSRMQIADARKRQDGSFGRSSQSPAASVSSWQAVNSIPVRPAPASVSAASLTETSLSQTPLYPLPSPIIFAQPTTPSSQQPTRPKAHPDAPHSPVLSIRDPRGPVREEDLVSQNFATTRGSRSSQHDSKSSAASFTTAVSDRGSREGQIVRPETPITVVGWD